MFLSRHRASRIGLYRGSLRRRSFMMGYQGESGLRPTDLGFGAVDAQVDQGDQQSVGEHQPVFWPGTVGRRAAAGGVRTRIAPPTAARGR